MSEDLDREWPLEQLLPAFHDAMSNELAVAFPARVESYDAPTQRADLAPMVQRTIRRDDGTPVRETLPTLRAVPVAFPRWGDLYLVANLSAGDFVLVVVCDRDPTRWLTTGELAPAPDDRLHHPAHAIAIPGVYPRTRPLGDSGGSGIALGADGGQRITVTPTEVDLGRTPSDFVALKGLVEAQLSTLKAAISGAVVVAGDGGASLKTTILAALTTWPGNTGASKVKAE